MSTEQDNVKLTAYALGELDDRQRAEVEQRLESDSAARREVEEIRHVAEMLGDYLQGEPLPMFTAEQRETFIGAARGSSARPRRVASWIPISLVASVLLVFGLLALGAIYYETFFRPRPHTGMASDENVYFQCQSCSHEYAKARVDLTKTQRFMDGEHPIYDDCPQCGAPGEGYKGGMQMLICHGCSKPYMPQGFKDVGKTWGQSGGNVCSHCGLDVDEHNRKEAAERRAKKRR